MSDSAKLLALIAAYLVAVWYAGKLGRWMERVYLKRRGAKE